MSNPEYIDVDYSETPDNLVGFPQPLRNVSEQPPQQPNSNQSYSSATLAEVAHVSRQSWGKDWFKHFEAVAPLADLKRGRQYTHLTYELTCSLRQARDQALSTAEWLEQIAIPTWGRTQQEFHQAAASQAIQSGALVPQSMAQASQAQDEGLVAVRELAGMAHSMFGELVDLLDAEDQQRQEQREAIEHQSTVARATVKVLKERRTEAQVRAELEADRQRKENERLKAEIARLTEGS